MRLDHIAIRCHDRYKTAQFYIDAFAYKVQQEFVIDFGDNEFANCIALEPPERVKDTPWTVIPGSGLVYHAPPEIFVSDGTEGSIVWNWVEKKGAGIHHVAYQVDSVEETMKLWREKGYAEFSSDQPMKCPGLTQVFTKPSDLIGYVIEFIERKEHGFCKDNVKALMEASAI